MGSSAPEKVTSMAGLSSGPAGSKDPLYDQPFVDIDEWRDQPVRHRYVHGGFESTECRFSIYFPPPERYEGRFFHATMFFGLYDDATRKLRYANCGHNPPLLLRREGAAERLMATTTVLGAFENWECSIAEVQLAPGDVLAIYTDGITEAANAAAEEFGEERLLQLLQASRNLAPAQLLEKVLAGVQQFSPGEQGDDLTLIVGRAR